MKKAAAMKLDPWACKAFMAFLCADRPYFRRLWAKIEREVTGRRAPKCKSA